MYRLKDGAAGGHPGPGQQLRRRRSAPYIKLDKDDRSGASANGENMDFFRPELIDFAVVFASSMRVCPTGGPPRPGGVEPAGDAGY